MTDLRAYLKSAGITQDAFAALIGASKGHVSELANGSKRPSLELAAAIERLTDGAVPAISWVAPKADGAAQ